ncbi:hypothetical protein AB0C34_20430 [Nocardia sp. NPDC049220]|uniref:hypothetical protein n=1 Tax=Nocardia sp. NPDC049220 TaxID=3155273 RepID=UPI0033C040EC
MTGTRLSAEHIADLTASAQPRDQALLLLSVDEAGTPRVALLSRAEVHVVADSLLLVAVWSGSRSATNIERSGAATLFWVVDGAAVSASLRCAGSRPLAAAPSGELAERALRALTLRVVDVRVDEVGYAELTAPLMFAVHEPEEIMSRWEDVARRLGAVALGLQDGSD